MARPRTGRTWAPSAAVRVTVAQGARAQDEGDGHATGVGGDLDEGLLPGRGEQPSGVAGAGGGDARGVHGGQSG